VANPALESLRAEVLEKEALLSQLRLEQRRRQEAKEQRKLQRHSNKLDHAIAKAQAELARESDESSSQGSLASSPESPPANVRTALVRGSVDSLRERLSGQQLEVRGLSEQLGDKEPQVHVPLEAALVRPASAAEAERGSFDQPGHIGDSASARQRPQQQQDVATVLPIDFQRSNSASSIWEASLPSSPRSAHSRSGAAFHARRANRGIPPQMADGGYTGEACDGRPPVAAASSAGLPSAPRCEPSAPQVYDEATPAHSAQAARDMEVDFELSPDSMAHTAPSSPGPVPIVAPAPPLQFAQAPREVPSSWEFAQEFHERADPRGKDAMADSLTEEILCDLLEEIDWSHRSSLPGSLRQQEGGRPGDLPAAIYAKRQRLTDEALEVSPLGKATEFADPTPHGDDQELASSRVRLKLIDVSQQPGSGVAEAITDALVGDLVTEMVERTSASDADAIRGLFRVPAAVGMHVVQSAAATSSVADSQACHDPYVAFNTATAAESSQSLTDNITESILSGLVDELAKDLSPQELAAAFEEGEPST